MADGSLFEGNYLNGKKSGKGILKFEDGSYYSGEFEGDLF